MKKQFSPTRRALLQTSAFAVVAASPLFAASRAAFGGARAPNIVFLLADDMGVADASCYGAPQIRTPAIDRIAREGALFTQAYANSAVCTASRTALITGRYQDRYAVGLEEPLGPFHEVALPNGAPTLPLQLKRAGYDTILLGKWHLGDIRNAGPTHHGYDHFFGFLGGALDYFSHSMMGKHDLWEDEVPVEKHGYLTGLLGDRAVEYIGARKPGDAPFFLEVHFNAPHWPWEGPEDEAESKRIGARTSDHDGGTLETYNKMVEAMDRQIGRILEAIERSGQSDNTIVIFTSDNGGERFSTTWPFNGRKSELLEGGLRIPSVIRWPARIPQGLKSPQTMMLMDWLPTLVAAAGAKPDPASPPDGIDLLPVLTREEQPRDRTLYWRYKANQQRAVREGDFKALKIGPNAFLFNVVADPMERANLMGRYPEVYKKLTDKWMTWNEQMLPEDPDSYTYDNDGSGWADRILTPKVDRKQVDDGSAWPFTPPYQD
jgi:arylsulfatase A-like enzyme